MYIRTKDKIYKVTNDKWGRNSVIEENGVFKIHCENMGHHWYSELEVIDQSEDLVKLCDEFICEWFDKEVNRYRHIYCSFKIGQSKELYRRDIPLPPNVDFEIYAGIWITGKGLTYVAKMDLNGDLKLREII